VETFLRDMTPIFKKNRLKEFDMCESTWLYEEAIDGDEFVEYAFFVLSSIEVWQVDSVYMDFSKSFDRGRYQLILEVMSAGIEPARCLWLRSYLTGRIIGDAVFKDIRVTSGVPQGSHIGDF
jgi:hypothetical protein